MKKLKTRRKAFICNMVIAFLALLSIVSYFFMPFWKVEVSCSINAQALELITGSESSEPGESNNEQGLTPISQSSSESSESGESGGGLGDFDIAEILGDESISLKLSISLKTSYILSSYGGDSVKTVQKILDDNVNSIIDQMYPKVNEIIKNVAKNAASTIIVDTVKDTLKEEIYAGKTDDEITQILTDAGLTEEYIDTSLTTVIDAFYAEDATVDSITNTVMDVVEDVSQTLSESGIEGLEDFTLDEEMKAEIEDGLTEVLNEFATEDGSVNIDDVLSELMTKLLNSDEESPEAASGIKTMSASLSESDEAVSESEVAAEGETDSKEELKAELRAWIGENIPADTAETITMILQYVGYLVFFTWFTWLYLILKILVKLNMKNNAIKLKLPILLGWIPALVLWLIPSLALKVLKKPSMLSSISADLVDSLSKVSDVINKLSLNITFTSCAMISFFIAVALFLFVIFYYGKIRRRLKKIKKGKIPESEDWIEEPATAVAVGASDAQANVENEVKTE